MAKCLIGVVGGLSAADKAKLIPENIREGVTLFEGTPREVSGSANVADATLISGICIAELGATQEFYIFNGEGVTQQSAFRTANAFPSGAQVLNLPNGKYRMRWVYQRISGAYLGPNIYCGNASVSFPASSAPMADSGVLDFEVTDENKLHIFHNTSGSLVGGQGNSYYWWLIGTINRFT